MRDAGRGALAKGRKRPAGIGAGSVRARKTARVFARTYDAAKRDVHREQLARIRSRGSVRGINRRAIFSPEKWAQNPRPYRRRSPSVLQTDRLFTTIATSPPPPAFGECFGTRITFVVGVGVTRGKTCRRWTRIRGRDARSSVRDVLVVVDLVFGVGHPCVERLMTRVSSRR